MKCKCFCAETVTKIFFGMWIRNEKKHTFQIMAYEIIKLHHILSKFIRFKKQFLSRTNIWRWMPVEWAALVIWAACTELTQKDLVHLQLYLQDLLLLHLLFLPSDLTALQGIILTGLTEVIETNKVQPWWIRRFPWWTWRANKRRTKVIHTKVGTVTFLSSQTKFIMLTLCFCLFISSDNAYREVNIHFACTVLNEYI